MAYCRNCGQPVDENARFCPHCGAKQFEETPQTVFCIHCGSEVNSDTGVCPNCGAKIEGAVPKYRAPQPQQQQVTVVNHTFVTNAPGGAKAKNKWIALLLCFFLGALGAHKFYEGKVGMGILYLFTLGLFGFGILFDLIRIIMKPEEYYY